MKKRSVACIVAAIGILIALAVILGIWRNNRYKSKNSENTFSKTEISAYGAEEEIKEAFKAYRTREKKAEQISDVLTLNNEISICFEGDADEAVYREILEELKTYDIKATFFIPAITIAENDQICEEILGEGHDIQNFTLNGSTHMEEQNPEEVIENICRSQKVYEKFCGYEPEVIKYNSTILNEDLLRVSGACGLEKVVAPVRYLNGASFSSQQMAKEYVSGLPYGTIITFKVSGYLDESEYEKGDTEVRDPAKDKKPEEELPEKDTENMETGTDDFMNVVAWTLAAVSERGMKTVAIKDFGKKSLEGLGTQYDQWRSANGSELTEPIFFVYTTDREAGFLFRNLGTDEEMEKLLNTMETLGVRGTFFVTGEQLEENWDIVQKIMAAGYEVENGGYQGINLLDADYHTICNEIYLGKLCFEKHGLSSTYYMPVTTDVSDEMKEAARALQVTMVSTSIRPARKEYIEEGLTAEEMVTSYFGDGRRVLCRGDLVLFDLTSSDIPEFTEQMLQAVYEKKVQPACYGASKLEIKTLSELMDHIWDYPAYTAETKNRIRTEGNTRGDPGTLIRTNYIGNQFGTLTGFSEEEAAAIDTTGRIDTGGTNTVFLTFDDWGDEKSIGNILYVLEKHHVQGTFFVKTKYVKESANNLLRAMAESGNDIASHTDSHMTVDISEKNVQTLKRDLVKSNQVLSAVAGNTGQLKNYFRPPTLAMNALGMRTIFDCGYQYIISGDNSTGDYDVSGKEELLDILIHGTIRDDGSRIPVQDGSIIILHMSETARYTAEALDSYLSYVEKLPAGDPGKHQFAKLSKYLGD